MPAPMVVRRFVGIDPGVSGGLALLDGAGAIVMAERMPDTELAIGQWFRFHSHVEVHAALERVHASPQMGVVSAFTFGRGYGALRMALAVARVPFEEVTPQRWQDVMGCRTGGDKNISKARAIALFPDFPVTHAVADALLLAEYCRRVHTGSIMTTHPATRGSHGQNQEAARTKTGQGREAIEETRRQKGRPSRRPA